jgi:hypothetical protein
MKNKIATFYNENGEFLRQTPLQHIDASQKFTTMYLLESGEYVRYWTAEKLVSIDVCGFTGIVTLRYESGCFIEITRANA